VRLIDVDPATYDFAPEALERARWDRVAAIVTHHLFGVPNNRANLAGLAAGEGPWLIDDAAQGLGAREGGAPLGGAGAAGILSFGRGKSLPALGGGAVLADAGGPLAEAAGPGGEPPRGTGALVRALGHRALFSPRVYGVARRVPFFRVGETTYGESFPIGQADGFTAALAARLLGGREDRAAARREAAAEYVARLAGCPALALPTIRKGAEPGFIRFPVLVPAGRRSEVIRRAGCLGVSLSYPSPIHRIEDLPRERLVPSGPLPGAERIAASLVTLPTHPLARPEDRERIARILVEVCA
jgi:aminotransferase EvaB